MAPAACDLSCGKTAGEETQGACGSSFGGIRGYDTVFDDIFLSPSPHCDAKIATLAGKLVRDTGCGDGEGGAGWPERGDLD